MIYGDDITIATLLDRRQRETPDHVYLRFEGAELTCDGLVRQVNRIANALLSMGLKPGDRVATMLRNGPAHVSLMLALMRTGIVWVPINYHLRGSSLEFLLEHSDPSLLVVMTEFRDLVSEAAPARMERVLLVESDSGIEPAILAAAAAAACETAPPVSIGPDDPVCISYTSGTTGVPKGVLMTDRMYRTCAAGMQHILPREKDAVLFMWEPLHHNAGNQVPIYALAEPVTIALHARFSASRFWSQASEAKARYAHYIGGVLQLLLKQPVTPAETAHQVSVAWGGGCPGEIWEQVRARFGVRLHEVWGMTETSSITTANLDGPVGSIGKALPHAEVRIRRIDGSGWTEPGEPGEMVVKALVKGVLTPGYFRNPEATAALYDGEWLRTGDKAFADADGNIFFLGRIKDSVRRRGENVSAWEVERVLNEHPAVVESAIVGVPTDIGEEDIKAFIRVKPDHRFDPGEFIRWCSDKMAYYQIPRYVETIEAFDVTATKRIRKETLSRATSGCWDREAHGFMLKGG